MAAVGAHLSHFIQHDAHSVLEWISTTAQWLGFHHFGSMLERADQGFRLADAMGDVVQLGQTVTKVADMKKWTVSDWTTAGRVVSKGGALVWDVASAIDFLSYIKVIALDSGLLSQISVIGNVASLARSAYKVVHQVEKIAKHTLGAGPTDSLKCARQATKLIRTITRIVCAILLIGVAVGALTVSAGTLLAISSAGLVLATASYLLKREICRLEGSGT